MSFNTQEISENDNSRNNLNILTQAQEKQTLTVNESEQSEDYESLKLRMKRKVADFFNLHKTLTYEKFNEFMDYIDLSQIFSTDDLEVIWKTFTIISDGRETIELEEAVKGVNELLSYFYSDNTDDLKTEEESNVALNQIEYSPVKENKNTSDEKYVLRTNYEIIIENAAEKINDNKANLLNNKSQLMNNTNNDNNNTKNFSSNKNLNLNFDKLEINNQANLINRSRQNSVNLSSAQINNLLNTQSANNSAIKPINPRHRRNITKIFKEIDIETLKQLRRVFSLLDIRNKEVLYIRELSDILKYKFINLSFQQLFDFLINLSYDDTDSNKLKSFESIHKQGKININFELYSRAISAIEQKILNENFEEFQETLNESYEVKETFGEVYENINQLDSESKDYISVLADIFISLRQKYETESSEIYGSIASLTVLCKNNNNNNSKINDNEIKKTFKSFYDGLENTKNQIADFFRNFKDKYNDIEVFLKDLNKNNLQCCNKISLLKLISEKYERTIKSLEDDYRNLFEKYNTTQPLEVNDDIGQLMDENAYLKDELENKFHAIESLTAEIRERDESIFNGKIELGKIHKANKEIEKESNNYKRSYEEVQKDYERLRNEIYEKILKEEEEASTGKSSLSSKKTNNSNNKSSLNDFENQKSNFVRNSVFLKEQFLKQESENANKIFEMSYEKLVLYCLDVEKANGKFNSLLAEKEVKIKSLEQEIENLNYLNQENSKKIYLLTSENARLNSRLNDILRENEFNKGFRPSIALNNRISMMSSNRGISITPNQNSNNNLFENNNRKNSNFFAFNKDKINNILQNKNENSDSNNYNKTTLVPIDNNDNNNKNIVNRKLNFETSMEKNEFSSYINKNQNTFEGNLQGKASIFEIYKEGNKNNNEIRLSTLEMDDEEMQSNKLPVQFIQKEEEINEDEVNELNNQLIAQQREFIKSASNFQIKYHSAFDTKISQNNIQSQQNRNSNLDYNPFNIDANAGFSIGAGKKSLEQENNCATTNNHNSIYNENKIDEHFIDREVETYSNYKSSNNNNLAAISNSKNNITEESSYFYNNTRRPTYISNNQGQINEISRISSFNFDKDLPNQDEWETNDIINNGDEADSTVDPERKFMFDFSGKTKKGELLHVNQIVDDIEEFEVNENPEGKVSSMITDIAEGNDIIKLEFENNSNPFGYESGKGINRNNQLLVTSNSLSKDNINSISKTVDYSLNSIKSDDRASKKYSLVDNNNSKNKKIEYSKINPKKEISEKIPEEEDHDEDELEKKDQVQPIEKFSINGLNNNTVKPTHNRNATMDLDKEFTKPSEYMCYDFLTLRRNVAIINMLDKYNEGVSSYEMFSENVHYFDDQKKKTKRYLFITCNYYFKNINNYFISMILS